MPYSYIRYKTFIAMLATIALSTHTVFFRSLLHFTDLQCGQQNSTSNLKHKLPKLSLYAIYFDFKKVNPIAIGI